MYNLFFLINIFKCVSKSKVKLKELNILGTELYCGTAARLALRTLTWEEDTSAEDIRIAFIR
jgi:hypothetical protein